MKKTTGRLYKAAVILCALALTLAGCAGQTPAGGPSGTGTATPSGGYIEKAIDMAEYATFTAPASSPDGTIWLCGKRADDSKWELVKIDDINAQKTTYPLETLGEDEAPSSVSVSPDGTVAVITSAQNTDFLQNRGDAMTRGGDGAQPPADGNAQNTPAQGAPTMGGQNQGGQFIMGGLSSENTVYWYDNAGSFVKQTELSVSGDMTRSFCALDGYEMLVATAMSGVGRYNSEGEQTSTFLSGYISAMAVDGTTLYAIEGMNGTLQSCDIETGKRYDDITGVPDITSGILLASGGDVNIVAPTGIWLIDPDTKEAKMTLDSVNYSLNDPELSVNGACRAGDGTIVISLTTQQGMGGLAGVSGGGVFAFGGNDQDAQAELYTYVWNPDLDLSNMKTLSITALYDSTLLRKAISEFQSMHPDVLVDLKTYVGANDEADDLTDFIRAINAELLADEGSDVYILDGLPVDSYIRKGVLLDISDILNEVTILPGINTGSKAADGKVYGLPAMFSFNTLWGNNELLGGVETLEDLAYLDAPDGMDVLAPRSAESLVRLFFEANKSKFVGEDGIMRFDTPDFEEFLELLAMLYVPVTDDGFTNQFSGDTITMARRGRYALDMSEMLALSNGTAALLPLNVSSVMQVDTAYSSAGAEESAWIGVPSLTGDSLSYTPSLIAGVNSRASDTDLAKEFVKMLFSPEVQSMAGTTGLPVTADALDALISEARDSERSMSVSIMGGPQINFVSAGDETWDALRAYCDAVQNPSVSDETLMGFICEETEKFFNGTMSAKDTAYAVQQRVAAYLAE